VSWWRHVRHAASYHTCTGCAGAIDDEEYTRTLIPLGNEHRRQLMVLKECQRCRPLTR
jgi:hypothetical protein